MSRPTLARVFLLSAAALSAASLLAEDPVTYVNVGPNKNLFYPSTWALTASGTPLTEFDTDGIYQIPSGYLNTDGSAGDVELTFPGRELLVQSGGALLPRTPNAIMRFDRDGLVFAAGSELRCHETGSADTTFTFRGKMTIGDGSSSTPVYVKATKAAGYGSNYVVESDLYGSSAAYVKLTFYKTGYVGWNNFVIKGDASNFKGCIMLMSYTNTVQFENATYGGTKVYMDAPARLILPPSGTLVTDVQVGTPTGRNTFEFRSSSNGEYGHLRYRASGTWKSATADPITLVVPTDLVLNGQASSTNGDTYAYTLIESTKLLETAHYQLEVTPSATGFALTEPALQAVKVGDLYQIQLTCKGPFFNRQLTHDASSNNHGSSFKAENATNWSRQVVMDANMVNVVRDGLQLMTHETVPNFMGLGLMVEGSSSCLSLVTSQFAVDNLILRDFGDIKVFTDTTLGEVTAGQGHINIQKGGCITGRGTANCTLVNNLPFVSDGMVSLTFRHSMVNGSTNVSYVVTLAKPSPNFLGNVDINVATTKFLPAAKGIITVAFSDPQAFGGPHTYSDESLKIQNGMRIRALETMTFDDQTRGFKNVGGRIDVVEGKTLTFNQPIRLAGVLKKEGLGTFARGGVHQLSLASGYSHDLEIYEGAVKPLTTNALDGARLVFKGGKLLIPVTSAAPFASYGMVTTRVAEPFATEGGAAIPLAFDMPSGGLADDEQTVAVCTVQTAATAEALANGGFRPQAMAGYSVCLSSAQTDAGYTVYATILRRGAMVFLR